MFFYILKQKNGSQLWFKTNLDIVFVSSFCEFAIRIFGIWLLKLSIIVLKTLKCKCCYAYISNLLQLNLHDYLV